MLLLFLFLSIFSPLTPTSVLCSGGPNCRIQLRFQDFIPSKEKLPNTCRNVNDTSCFFYAVIDAEHRKVDVLFRGLTESRILSNTNDVPMIEICLAFNKSISPFNPFIDLLATNSRASIIRRSTIQAGLHGANRTVFAVLLQCSTRFHCSLHELRQFWVQLTQWERRSVISKEFHRILSAKSPPGISCYNETTDEVERCSNNENACARSSSSLRQCVEYNSIEHGHWSYSYNEALQPHQLTDENVEFDLLCRVSNCNDNATIDLVKHQATLFSCEKRNYLLLFLAE
jgi:hypothetical protein